MAAGGGKRRRLCIIVLLVLTVVTPIFLFHDELAAFSDSLAVEDASEFDQPGTLLEIQEGGNDVKDTGRIVYKDDEFKHVNSRISNNTLFQYKKKSAKLNNGPERNGSIFGDTGKDSESRNEIESPAYPPLKGQQLSIDKSHFRKLSAGVVRSMNDQLTLAKAYLNFVPPNSNPLLVQELRLAIKENERAIGEATRDSALRGRIRSMESILCRVGRIYSRCSSYASKLRGMIDNTDEQLRTERNQTDFLIQLAGRTFPKGFHCLYMRLTADYFSLQPGDRKFVDQKLEQPDLYHYAIFSNNILACSVVVNSTVSTSKEPEKIVFHIVTDALNFPAISMWFLSSPPGKATIEVLSIDDIKPSSANVSPISTRVHRRVPQFISGLNNLQFYLPELFPYLDKIVFLSHDVAVQKDLSGLWGLKMNGKVIGTVEICIDDEHEFSQVLNGRVNLSDPFVSKVLNAKVCSWSFGMNIINLQMWRKHALTHVYHKWFQLVKRKKLWKDGSLGGLHMLTFYNYTMALDQRWHLRGLGKEQATFVLKDIEGAAVLQYDGLIKPWLEAGTITRYNSYWSKFAPYDHPLLLQCNIHS